MGKAPKEVTKGSGFTAGKFLPAGRGGIYLKTLPILSNETDLRQGTRVIGLAGSWRGPIPVGRCPPPHLGLEQQWQVSLGTMDVGFGSSKVMTHSSAHNP